MAKNIIKARVSTMAPLHYSPRLLLIIMAIYLLAACSNRPQFGAIVSEIINNDTYDVQVKLEVSLELNPNRNGRPSPLVLRIFQLTDDAKFPQSNIDNLFLDAETELSSDLIKIDQTMIFPGKGQEYELNINADTKFLGIAAAFQEEGGIAKKIIDIEGRWSRDICIELSGTSMVTAKRC